MHADFGRGGYIGVDGATFTGGNIYSHVQTGPVSLSAGEHEFEALGFEDCCDGFSVVEVHLPCDSAASPWRIVQSGSPLGTTSTIDQGCAPQCAGEQLGEHPCLTCGVVLAAECSGPLTDPGTPSQPPLARPLRRAMTVRQAVATPASTLGPRWLRRSTSADEAMAAASGRARQSAPSAKAWDASHPRVRLGLFVCKKERC